MFVRFYLLIFTEKGREGQRAEQKQQCERKIIYWLPLARLQHGTEPTNQRCAPTGIEPAKFRFEGRHPNQC